MKTSNKIIVTSLLAVALFLTGLLGILIVNDISGETTVEVMENKIILEGKATNVISLEEANVEIVNKPVCVNLRVNGTSSEKSYEGIYNVNGIDKSAHLVILNKDNAYILITTNGEYYLINGKTNKETNELYREMLSAQEED